MRYSEQERLAGTVNDFITRNHTSLEVGEVYARYSVYRAALTSHVFGVILGLIVLICLAIGNMAIAALGINFVSGIVTWPHVALFVFVFLCLSALSAGFQKVLLATIGAIVTLGLTILIWMFLPIPFAGANVFIALFLFLGIALAVYAVSVSIYQTLTGKEAYWAE